ncbi:radical SAM protein [Ktedonosporobacter rubrisoli]|uniref:Radical SAM protein n=1 Tax=Ktedonosporobacter rubrisoli TaxID=2509675 RepID=A0A4P6JTT8_KTERU|nr:radical SAM protein [Ktedonosporobacter rubrisoli]QBD78326.1 radical SAM protein [Ktedonosporobacter rubrisoli]
MPLPTYIQIEPVGQCNLRCQMCSLQFRQDGPPYGPPAFMHIETFRQIIDQFTDLHELHLQGLGEPMMHPRFFEMVEYAASKGIRVTTNSNLTLLNERRAERCVTSGLERLHISIDGATASTYEHIRVRAHFERIMANLERLLRARERHSSERPELCLVMVIMRQNLHELPDIVRLAHRFAMKSIFVQHLCHDFGEESLPSRYLPMREFVQKETLLEEDPQRIEHYFNEARTMATSLGIDLRLPHTRMRIHPPGTPGPQRCDWPWKGAYFSYQGYAMPCCMVSTPDRINFGKIADQSAQTLWNNPGYQAFRDRLSSDEPPEICSSCSIYRGTF